jgi:S1-C subfamily serine protease
MRRAISLLASTAAILSLACSHELQIKNLGMYQASYQVGAETARPRIGILPFEGTPEDLFYFNTIVERLSADPGIADLRTDYMPRIAEARPGPERLFKPDLVLAIKPKVTYRSSGWNFLVNWPGFLIFTPAWNGYVYHADLMTTFVTLDAGGKTLDQLEVPMSLSIRHADANRSVWAGLSWFEVSLLAFSSGIYFANSFDREVIPPFQNHVKDTYANYVISQARKRVQSVAAALPGQPEAAVGAPPPGSRGSCFAVGTHTLLTANHVLGGARSVRVHLPGGAIQDAEVSDVSSLNDVAVLRLKQPVASYLRLAAPRAAATGQRVFTIGYPAASVLGTEPKFSDGTISALSGPGNERNFLQVTVPIQPGSSGGPLVTESGEVVGIVTASAAIEPFLQSTGALPQNVNWAVNIDFARPLLDASEPGPRMSREEAIAKARASVCLVEIPEGAPQ